MVLDAGKIAEFDTPANLIQDKYSKFSLMAKSAGLDALLKIPEITISQYED